MIGAGDEDLFHFRLDGQGGRADAIGVDGHFTVAQYFQAQLLRRAGEDVAAFFFQPDVRGKKSIPTPYLPYGGRWMPS